MYTNNLHIRGLKKKSNFRNRLIRVRVNKSALTANITKKCVYNKIISHRGYRLSVVNNSVRYNCVVLYYSFVLTQLNPRGIYYNNIWKIHIQNAIRAGCPTIAFLLDPNYRKFFLNYQYNRNWRTKLYSVNIAVTRAYISRINLI